jgi:hypothetical protein
MTGVRRAVGRRAAIVGAALANTGRPLVADAGSVRAARRALADAEIAFDEVDSLLS